MPPQNFQGQGVACERLAIRKDAGVNEWAMMVTTDAGGNGLIRIRDGAKTLNFGVAEFRKLLALIKPPEPPPPPPPPPP